MELILKRIAKRKCYTIGRLYIADAAAPHSAPEGATTPSPSANETTEAPSGAVEGATATYFCDTLEPTWRDYKHGAYKMKGHSAIPEGRYPVVVSYSPRFEQWLPLLLHVPKFEGIRIHAGNMSCDTEGCILVGENRKVGQVLDSRRHVNLLKRRLAERPEGEPIYITIE